MNIENEILSYDVSRETYQKLSAFVALLTEWNFKLNLVSKNSMPEVWTRHILDSIQLIKHIDSNTKNIVDIGSGAGFPAIVLAIVLQEKNPAIKLKLVESITKKTVYLKDICEKLGLNNVEVLNTRVENYDFTDVDLITARAVASLDVLCQYCHKIGNSKTSMLLLKGKTYAEENQEAQKKWTYKLEVLPNHYSDDGVILKLSNLRYKK